MNSKKSNISRILLSIVALLVILSVGVGVTFAWIEGGDSYSLYTTNIPIDGPALPASKFVTTGTITMDPKKTNVIKLGEIYDNTTVVDNVMFAPMSSDGSNFYLPQAYDESGEPSYFREATTNDKGIKYIDFDFDVLTTTQCYIAFASNPTITVKKGESVLENADTSALRFMITDGSGVNQIFSTSSDSITNGKVSKGGSSFENTLTVNPLSQYTNNNENKDRRLYTFDNKEVSSKFRLAIWLDCFGNADSLETLAGSTITIDLNLVVDQEKVNIKFTPVTLDNTGNKVEDGTLGGKVSPVSKDAVIGDTVELSTATVNANYTFLGWFKTNSDFDNTSNRVTTDLKLSQKVDGEITQYYAVFKEKPKYTITVGSFTDPIVETGGTVTIGGNTGSLTDYKDKEITLTATPEDGYRFAGWYSDSDCNSSTTDYKNPTNEGKSVTVTIDKNKSYYAKFIKQVTLSVDITGEGSVTIDGNNVTSLTVDYNQAVKLSATPSTGYSFEGFYDSNNNKLANNSTVTVNEDVIYTAKFNVNSYTVTFIAKTNDTVSNEGGTISPASSTVEYNKTVTLTATPKSGYKLDGIYRSSDNSKLSVTVDGSSYKATVTVIDNVEYYAKFVPDTITIYFSNSMKWDTVYCHYWGGSSSSEWPGVQMTYYTTNAYDEKVYTISLPAGTTGVVFTTKDGSPQTVDISSNDIVNGKGFYVKNEKDNNNYKYGTYDDYI